MGLGNGNPNEGNKGSNFNYELKTLQLLEAIAVAIEQGGGGGGITCDDLGGCQIIKDLQSAIDTNTDQLATIESACFSPSISTTDGIIGKTYGQYQRVGNIVTCTVFFTITGAVGLDAIITIDVPTQEPSSDYSVSDGLIMGSISSLAIYTWRDLNFAGGSTNGIIFFVRNPTSINNKYTAQFSYAYDTNGC